MAGVEATGFVSETVDSLKAAVETDQLADIDPSLNLTATSVLGQLNGIYAGKLAEAWEALQAVYSAFDPDAASGASLERIAAITGTVRKAATKSTLTATVNLDAGATLAIGAATASDVGNPSARFVNTTSATNGGGSPANFQVEMEAEVTGPVTVNVGQMTVIETPVSGWNSITNDTQPSVVAGTIGTDLETDAALRVRREDELRQSGAGTVEAIRADLLQNVDGVTASLVIENDGITVDGAGRPPKSFEAVVVGGTNDDVAQQIWDSKPAGIETHGGTSGNATDSGGVTRVMNFSRPTLKTVYLEIDIAIDSDTYPIDGDAQVAAAVAAFAALNLSIGDDVILSALYPSIFSIAGVLDVTEIRADFTASPVPTANLTIAETEFAEIVDHTVDPARIVVATTP